MPDSLTIPQHDRRPYVRLKLRDGDKTTDPVNVPDGYAVVLGASDTAFWLMRPVGDATNVLRVAMTIITRGTASTGASDPGTPAVVEWRPAATGAPSAWGGGGHHTATCGIYDVEVELLDSTGLLAMTLPTDLPNTLTIRDDVDSGGLLV